MKRIAIALLALFAVARLSSSIVAAEPPASFSPEQIEFFEKKVRPLLVANCRECHGPDKQKGGLRVDSRGALLKGGDSGPAIVPGKPDDGYLVDAINYGDTYKMPPRGKLPAEAIATLTQWIRMGAPWPEEQPAHVAKKPSDTSFAERMRHWSFQPVRPQPPPAVKDKSWVATPIDRFILARLEAAGLKPNPPADPYTLIRRVTFDLTGLPPTAEEVEEFVAGYSPSLHPSVSPSGKNDGEIERRRDREKRYEALVDHLLDSPRYGERWARHWLDLVRYAETCGHEFDFELSEAYEYRDYVIRALNVDLPYDQFIIEHIAGDLLPQPRRHPREKFNESIIGTGFYFLGEAKHSPVDIRADECERMDNQIDVLCKTFLALTVSCARCHDHKFDPIAAQDYYALAGFLQSSRFDRTYVEDPSERQKAIGELTKLREELPRLLATDADHSDRASSARSILFQFEGPTYGDWIPSGDAFGAGPTTAATSSLMRREGKWHVSTVPAEIAHSGLISTKLRGALRSPTFKIAGPVLSYRLAGADGAKINLIIDGYQLIRNPIYGGLTIPAASADRFVWHRQDVSKWIGHNAYIEVIDDGDGWAALDAVIQGEPPRDDRNGKQLADRVVEADGDLAVWLERFAQVERRVNYQRRVMAMAEGTPENEFVLLRGNHRLLGDEAPRQFIGAIREPGWELHPLQGSGRLELARQIASPNNPLTARVIANRLWKHHFGVGLVPTVDDFGHMGQPPSHPELLDFLATELVRQKWSLKALHRMMVLSSVYRQSSEIADWGLRIADSQSRAKNQSSNPQSAIGNPQSIDPTNRLLWRMNVRRLEAEAIRDSLLAVSGSLDDRMYGPSVPPQLTPFMDGRGRPRDSGPLDGAGRRSIYLGVRRNFLSPMFLAFDFPVPFSTIGRRTVSNVPAQALAMMNNPLVLDQSRKWAERLLKRSDVDTRARIERMYLSSIGRAPTADELQSSEQFIADQLNEYGKSEQARAWTDLCHVMFNLKEFIFIP